MGVLLFFITVIMILLIIYILLKAAVFVLESIIVIAILGLILVFVFHVTPDYLYNFSLHDLVTIIQGAL